MIVVAHARIKWDLFCVCVTVWVRDRIQVPQSNDLPSHIAAAASKLSWNNISGRLFNFNSKEFYTLVGAHRAIKSIFNCQFIQMQIQLHSSYTRIRCTQSQSFWALILSFAVPRKSTTHRDTGTRRLETLSSACRRWCLNCHLDVYR